MTLLMMIVNKNLIKKNKFSDVQELTLVEHDGRRIGIGDMVEWDEDYYKVYDYYWDGDSMCILAIDTNDDSDNWHISPDNITNVIPKSTETIEINGKKYYKNEYDGMLKKLEEVK